MKQEVALAWARNIKKRKEKREGIFQSCQKSAREGKRREIEKRGESCGTPGNVDNVIIF